MKYDDARADLRAQMCNAALQPLQQYQTAVAAISPPAIEQGFSSFETARSWINSQVRTKSLSFVVLFPRMFLSGRPPVLECNLQPAPCSALCSAGDDVCRMLCRSSGSPQVRLGFPVWRDSTARIVCRRRPVGPVAREGPICRRRSLSTAASPVQRAGRC